MTISRSGARSGARSQARTHLVGILQYVFEQLMTNGRASRGVDADIRRALRGALREAERRRAKAPSPVGACGSLLYRWHAESAYVDEHAKPKALRLRGRAPSVEALARREVPKSQVSALLTTLQRNGLIRRDGKDAYVPTSRGAIVRQPTSDMIEHYGGLIVGLLNTIEQNARVRRLEDALIQRGCVVPDLPRREVPAFKRFTRRQSELLIDHVNEWLEQRRPRNGARRTARTVAAGIHVYAHMH